MSSLVSPDPLRHPAHMIDPTPYLVRWRLTDPAPLKTQGHAHVWRVRQADGQPAALKIFARDDWGNERHAAL